MKALEPVFSSVPMVLELTTTIKSMTILATLSHLQALSLSLINADIFSEKKIKIKNLQCSFRN